MRRLTLSLLFMVTSTCYAVSMDDLVFYDSTAVCSELVSSPNNKFPVEGSPYYIGPLIAKKGRLFYMPPILWSGCREATPDALGKVFFCFKDSLNTEMNVFKLEHFQNTFNQRRTEVTNPNWVRNVPETFGFRCCQDFAKVAIDSLISQVGITTHSSILPLKTVDDLSGFLQSYTVQRGKRGSFLKKKFSLATLDSIAFLFSDTTGLANYEIKDSTTKEGTILNRIFVDNSGLRILVKGVRYFVTPTAEISVLDEKIFYLFQLYSVNTESRCTSQ